MISASRLLLWLCLTAPLCGCVTERLWKGSIEHETYKERVSSVLISQDGKTLAVIGKDHHYLFEAPPVIARTLTSDYQKFTSAEFGTFSVAVVWDGSEAIMGVYSLRIDSSATEQAKTSAKSLGFAEDAEGRLSIKGVLYGIRYGAGNVQIESRAHPLTREYFVEVSAPRPADRTFKVLLTPLAVLADGVIVMGMIVMRAIPVPDLRGFRLR
jgi:hypothetical protein